MLLSVLNFFDRIDALGGDGTAKQRMGIVGSGLSTEGGGTEAKGTDCSPNIQQELFIHWLV